MSIISAGTSNTTSLVYTGDTTGNLAFQINGTTEAMRITASGNVGVGINNPQRNLHINGSSTQSFQSFTTSNTGTAGTDGTLIGIQSDNSFQIYNYEDSYIRFATYDTERMRITSAGYVGIGSNSPSNQLYVQGTGSGFGAYDVPLSIKGTTYTLMELKGTNTIASIVYNRDGNNGWLVGMDNSGNYRIAPMTEMNQTGVSNAKDSTTTGVILDTSSNFKFNSGYGSVATAYGVRAWVYFNTSGSILGSGNVSSVSKNSTGNYTANFTNALPNANYSAVATADIGGWNTGATQTGGYNTTSISIQTRNLSMVATDASVSVVIVR